MEFMTARSADVVNVEAYEVAVEDFRYSLGSAEVGCLYFRTY